MYQTTDLLTPRLTDFRNNLQWLRLPLENGVKPRCSLAALIHLNQFFSQDPLLNTRLLRRTHENKSAVGETTLLWWIYITTSPQQAAEIMCLSICNFHRYKNVLESCDL